MTAALSSAFLPLPDQPWGHDGSIHAANVQLLAEALRAGEWAPRWLPEANGGRGGPNFRYYAFASYYPSAFLVVGGYPVLEALRIGCRLCFFVGFVGAACLSAHLFGVRSGLLAGGLYSLSPYPLVLVGTRLALPEYAALSVAPWAFVALVRWASSRRLDVVTKRANGVPGEGSRGLDAVRTNSGFAAFALALLVAIVLGLHTLAVLLWLPFLLAGGMFFSGRGLRGAMEGLWVIGGGVLAGTILWAPSVLELDWIDASRQLVDLERFSAWAVPLWALVANQPEGGLSARLVPGPLLLAALLIAVGRELLRIWRRLPPSGEDRSQRAFLLFAVAALGMTTGFSVTCARAVPLLSAIQFPWRFLGPFSLFAAVLAAGVVSRLERRLALGASLAALVISWGVVLPGYVAPARNGSFAQNAAEIRSDVYTGDFENRYLPRGARLASIPVDQAIIVGPGVRCKEIEENRWRICARVEADSPARLLVRRYWFAGWRATLDGKSTSLERDRLDGEIALEVPPGTHQLRVYREVRMIDVLYAMVSISAIGALAWGVFCHRGCRVAWAPCAAAAAATLAVGFTSAEGFAPLGAVRHAIEADVPSLERPSVGGWCVVHYHVREGALDFDRPQRGFCADLNLGPGGAIRQGLGVWAAHLRFPPDVDAALEHAGSVVLFVDGERMLPSPAEPASEAGESAGLCPIPWGPRGSPSASGRRVVVAAARIEYGARARLLVRARGGSDPWRLVPSSWLEPDEGNEGYRELFPSGGSR